MAACSILKKLAEREVSYSPMQFIKQSAHCLNIGSQANGWFERETKRRLLSYLPSRCVSLSQIMDSEGKIAQG